MSVAAIIASVIISLLISYFAWGALALSPMWVSFIFFLLFLAAYSAVTLVASVMATFAMLNQGLSFREKVQEVRAKMREQRGAQNTEHEKEDPHPSGKA